MNFINKYLGLDSVQLNPLQIALRIIVAFLTFLLFIKLSGVHLFDQKRQSSLDLLITAIAVITLVSSISTVNSFQARLVSIIVFAVLLRLIALYKNLKRKD